MTNETLTFQIPDKPGELAKMTQCLAENHVNVTAITADSGNVCINTNDNNKAVTCLQDNGYNINPTTTFAVDLPNEPGQLARISNELGNAGVNINTVFGEASGGTGTINFVVDNPDTAKPVFEKFGTATVQP